MMFFSIEELSHSDTARKKGIDNSPSQDIRGNMEALIDRILDPLRIAYDKPILVNSGYRSAELNKAVGGSKTSDHLTGRAADITAGSRAENMKLFNLIQSMGLPFDQLIFEKGSRAQGPDWVHVSYNPSRNRKQILYLV